MNRLFLLICCLLPLFSIAQQPTTPAVGSADRKALMNALRPAVEAEIGLEVIFEVRNLQLLDGWAYGDLIPRQKNGKAIDYQKSKIDPEVLQAFDDWICVLWHKESDKWKVVTYILGATDVPYGCWWKDHNAPKAIFPHTVPDADCQTE